MPVSSPGKAVRFCNPETSSVCTIESVAFEKVTAQSLPVYYSSVNVLMYFSTGQYCP